MDIGVIGSVIAAGLFCYASYEWGKATAYRELASRFNEATEAYKRAESLIRRYSEYRG